MKSCSQAESQPENSAQPRPSQPPKQAKPIQPPMPTNPTNPTQGPNPSTPGPRILSRTTAIISFHSKSTYPNPNQPTNWRGKIWKNGQEKPRAYKASSLLLKAFSSLLLQFLLEKHRKPNIETNQQTGGPKKKVGGSKKNWAQHTNQPTQTKTCLPQQPGDDSQDELLPRWDGHLLQHRLLEAASKGRGPMCRARVKAGEFWMGSLREKAGFTRFLHGNTTVCLFFVWGWAVNFSPLFGQNFIGRAKIKYTKKV